MKEFIGNFLYYFFGNILGVLMIIGILTFIGILATPLLLSMYYKNVLYLLIYFILIPLINAFSSSQKVKEEKNELK